MANTPDQSSQRERAATEQRVKQFILDHGYQPGDVLPAEAEFAETLGISRPSLREAIRALQSLGVVASRHGAGTYVGSFSFSPLVDSLAFSVRLTDAAGTLKAIREILQVREILEGELIAAAVFRLTDAHLARLEALVTAMETRAVRGEESADEDRAFHQTIYEPLGNPLVVQLIHAFWEVFTLVRAQLPAASIHLPVNAADHRRILEALQRRDPRAASAAMTVHFGGLQRRIMQTEIAREGQEDAVGTPDADAGPAASAPSRARSSR